MSRVTLVGERRRVDLVLPSREPIGLLLPEVMRLLDDRASARPELRHLVTVDGSALDQDSTLESAGVPDGAVLRLVPRPRGRAGPLDQPYRCRSGALLAFAGAGASSSMAMWSGMRLGATAARWAYLADQLAAGGRPVDRTGGGLDPGRQDRHREVLAEIDGTLGLGCRTHRGESSQCRWCTASLRLPTGRFDKGGPFMETARLLVGNGVITCNAQLSRYPHFRLPSFPRFGPARRRPDLEHLEARCGTWLRHHLRDAYRDDPSGLEHFLGQRTTLWNLLTYPTAGTERIQTICNWIDVLFNLDDLFVHASAAKAEQLGLRHLQAVIDGRPVTADTAYIRTFACLRRRTRPSMPVPLWDRFAHTLEGFLDACRTERYWQETRAAIDLPTYEESRGRSIGECCFPLLEYGLGLDLSGELETHPELERLNVLVARHWIGVNDIFSYRKESYSGDTMNEISLLLAENDGDLQAAVDRVAGTVRRTEEEFAALSEHFLCGSASDNANAGVRQYVEALKWMITGNLEWSYITTRYNGPGHVWNGETSASVVLTPHRTRYLPCDGP